MVNRDGKHTKAIRKPGKKKAPGRWFSPDRLMGKVLCILLVLILTVGAFLAPKMIHNLYDAGTLMQITYTDMDLSTYAVAYTEFPEKIEALAQGESAGERLAVLPAEESSERISDEELIRIVNKEIDSMEGLSILFKEEWWSELTEENLVSRVKNTAYMQPQGDAQENISGREMAPLQFWMLSFEVTQEQQGEYLVYDEQLSPEEKKGLKASVSRYATDRLIVCLDTDFYKIYAIAVAGNGKRIGDMYGWDLEWTFQPAQGGANYEWFEFRTELIYQILGFWIEYWEVVPDYYIPVEISGELTGGIVFRNMEPEEGSAAADAGTEEENIAMIYDMDEGVAVDRVYDYEAAAVEEHFPDTGYSSDEGIPLEEDEMLLTTGCRGEWSDMDDTVWIQKMGCREFFEMMQF